MTETIDSEEAQDPPSTNGLKERWARVMAVYRRLHGRYKVLRGRDKEITSAWKQRAKNQKFYRILWMFATFVPALVLWISGLNRMAGTAFAYSMGFFGAYESMHGNSTAAQHTVQNVWTVERYLLWIPLILIGVMMAITVVFACYLYKQIVKEICLIVPGFSMILNVVLSRLHVKWVHALAEGIRQFIPDNLYDVYDFVMKFAIPIAIVYVSVIGYFVSFCTNAIRVQLHRGFIKYGDDFRNSEYYKDFTSTETTPMPTLREQVSLVKAEWRRRRNQDDAPDNDDEKVPGPITFTRETLRSIFPKDF